MTKTMRGNLLLILTALIWGVAFVAQSAGMDYVGPYTFLCTRSILGGVVLLPIIHFTGRNKPKEAATPQSRRAMVVGGICCGTALCVASAFQQIGILYTTVGKAGFITAMYIVLVPLCGLFLHKKVGKKVWIGVVLAVVGLYLLCMSERLSVNKGDLLMLICALCFAIHILVVDHFGRQTDGVKLSCIQFFVCALLSGILMLLLETPSWETIRAAWLPICYAGLLSSGAGYTLQILGQKDTDPTVASLLMSLESVFAAIAGWLLLHERFSLRELAGVVLMAGAIVLAQLPEGRNAKN
jgi:drug/metabolite transporter (DMT)-like permease